MKNVFKKNQIVVFVIGLMIITAGYLSYTNNASLEASAIADSEEIASIGDAKLVSANIVDTNSIDTNNITEDSAIANSIENSISNNTYESTVNNDESYANALDSSNEIIDTSSEVTTTSDDEYFTNSRLERNTMYSQRIENYQDILNNTNVSETQKKTAQEEITKLNNEQNAIMIAENLIKTKGIEDLVIFANGDSINVIVKGDDLEKEEIAQIQNIITRELEADIENIHIMNK